MSTPLKNKYMVIYKDKHGKDTKRIGRDYKVYELRGFIGNSESRLIGYSNGPGLPIWCHDARDWEENYARPAAKYFGTEKELKEELSNIKIPMYVLMYQDRHGQNCFGKTSRFTLSRVCNCDAKNPIVIEVGYSDDDGWNGSHKGRWADYSYNEECYQKYFYTEEDKEEFIFLDRL